MIEHIFTEKAPKAIGPYSQAVSAGGFLYTSGQIAINPETGAVNGTTIEEQAEQVMKNIKEIFAARGITFDNTVKTTCFLTDMNDFTAFNEVYGKYFTSKPARSCVEVSQLPKGVLCEVEAVAVL